MRPFGSLVVKNGFYGPTPTYSPFPKKIINNDLISYLRFSAGNGSRTRDMRPFGSLVVRNGFYGPTPTYSLFPKKIINNEYISYL